MNIYNDTFQNRLIQNQLLDNIGKHLPMVPGNYIFTCIYISWTQIEVIVETNRVPDKSGHINRQWNFNERRISYRLTDVLVCIMRMGISA